jgi:hypothetical protein
MRRSLFFFGCLLMASQAFGLCSTPSLADATKAAKDARKTPSNYSPRGTFKDCFFDHFNPDDKSDYEDPQNTNATKEDFLFTYMMVAFDAAKSAPPRAADYYRYAIGAADAYLELTATDAMLLHPDRVRDVLDRLGEAYYNRRDVDGNAMQDLVFQYESIAVTSGFGARCFDRRSVDQWERALRCISGNCNAQDAQLESKIRAERATSTEFVQRCTSYAEFLTIACADTRLAALKPRKQKFDRFLQVPA